MESGEAPAGAQPAAATPAQGTEEAAMAALHAKRGATPAPMDAGTRPVQRATGSAVTGSRQASQESIVNAYTLIAALYCAASAWLFSGPVGDQLLGTIHLVALAGVVVNYILLQVTRNLHWATNGILSMGTLVVVSLFATGGWHQTGMLWTFAYLPYAFFLADRSEARLWVTVLVAIDAMLSLLHVAGRIALPYDGVGLAMFWASLGIFLLCMFIFKASVLRSETLAAQRADALAAANAQLVKAEEVRQRAAAQVQEIEALRQVSRVKSQFMSTAAHELNTPLTPIRLELHSLKSEAIAGSPEKRRRSLDVLERNIRRLGSLVQDLLDGARMQSGRFDLELAPVDMARLVADQVEVRRRAAPGAPRTIEMVVEGTPVAMADAARIEQVVDNLLTNAVKFTRDGGRIEIQIDRAPGGVAVRIHDDGAGLTDAEISKLFQPFVQVHDTSQQTRPGSGLGLYIARGIVEAHGGTIGVESEGHGKGSTFWFVLPSAQAQPPLVKQQRRPAGRSDASAGPPH